MTFDVALRYYQQMQMQQQQQYMQPQQGKGKGAGAPRWLVVVRRKRAASRESQQNKPHENCGTYVRTTAERGRREGLVAMHW